MKKTKKTVKVRKRDIHKEIVFNGLKLKIVSRGQFAKYLGFTVSRFARWERAGIFPPPTLVDNQNTVRNWNGEEVSRKFYLLKEAQLVRAILRGYKLGRRIKISDELKERVSYGIERLRAELEEGTSVFADYNIVLEFENYGDLKKYLEIKLKNMEVDIDKLALSIYQDGDKLLSK